MFTQVWKSRVRRRCAAMRDSAVVMSQCHANSRLFGRLRTQAPLRTRTARRATAAAAAAAAAAGKLDAEHVQQGVTLYAPTEHALAHVAAQFARELRKGDCYCLYGDVGAGKSVWSRAFIRAASEDPYLPVPSPTYLLQNTYDDHGEPALHHFDLYRLSSERDLQRLDLRQSMSDAVCLVEWAERLGGLLPAAHLAVHISIVDEPPRQLSTSQGAQGPRSTPWDQSRGSAGESGVGPYDGEEDEDCEFSDRRCRKVTLVPHGHLWSSRLLVVVQELGRTSREEGAGVWLE